MDVSNAEVAQAFEDIAILLELENANPFRIRAYQNAARVINGLSQPVTDLLAKAVDLSEYRGIGKDLSKKIMGYVKTGHIPLLDELSKHHPKGIIELARIENLGPKRIQILHDKLGITSLKDLKSSAEKGQIKKVKGFGEKTEKKILKAIKELTAIRKESRVPLHLVDQIARQLVLYLKKSKEVRQVEVAGSYRRRKETVGDLDILVTCNNSKNIIDHFVAYENVKNIISKGSTRSSVVLRDGLHVDLRVLKEESFGSGLYYFTGSKAHNIEVRKIAKKMGLKINEYGVFKGSKKIAGVNEEEVFKAIHLDYIPPELRENRGEIKAASEHCLPNLITVTDLRGDLHAHTTATDGKNTILEMAEKARELGHNYLAITDHSQHVHVANGLDVERLKKHIKDIDRINEKISGIKILKGIEVDILEDGSLDLPNSILAELDIRICSIHYKLKMNKKDMTERIIRAMDNPYFNILGHPTGRLIFKRAPYEFDLEKVVKAAVERGKFFEINCRPDRLDLSAEHCQMVQELGAKFAISTDAHSTMELNFLNFGTDQARRGWVEKKNVINSLMWKELRKLLSPNL
ncbi:MAG: DNA polymerase/3'-5' exonuclease PolX [Bacteriovorax sp.]|nr:DNA polymerase/3'-5' exonuclease PolX [Bacteriovorax sp.]